jgi:hypothetical protein
MNMKKPLELPLFAGGLVLVVAGTAVACKSIWHWSRQHNP